MAAASLVFLVFAFLGGILTTNELYAAAAEGAAEGNKANNNKGAAVAGKAQGTAAATTTEQQQPPTPEHVNKLLEKMKRAKGILDESERLISEIPSVEMGARQQKFVEGLRKFGNILKGAKTEIPQEFLALPDEEKRAQLKAFAEKMFEVKPLLRELLLKAKKGWDTGEQGASEAIPADQDAYQNLEITEITAEIEGQMNSIDQELQSQLKEGPSQPAKRKKRGLGHGKKEKAEKTPKKDAAAARKKKIKKWSGRMGGVVFHLIFVAIFFLTVPFFLVGSFFGPLMWLIPHILNVLGYLILRLGLWIEKCVLIEEDVEKLREIVSKIVKIVEMAGSAIPIGFFSFIFGQNGFRAVSEFFDEMHEEYLL